MVAPSADYPKSSGTDQTASGPEITHGANDGVTPSPVVQENVDNGCEPPMAPRASSNADQVNKHRTAWLADGVLGATLANAQRMHDQGDSGGSKRYE